MLGYLKGKPLITYAVFDQFTSGFPEKHVCEEKKLSS